MDQGAHFYRCDFQVHSPRDTNWNGHRPITDEERKAYSEQFIDLLDIINFGNPKRDRRIKSLIPPERYTRKGWEVNPRFRLAARVFTALGIVSVTWAMVHADDFDSEFDDIETKIGQMRGERNELDAKLKAIAVLTAIVQYFQHFNIDNSILDAITIQKIYDIIGR
jgi:hypothetical protein